jgi:hypothetical protein
VEDNIMNDYDNDDSMWGKTKKTMEMGCIIIFFIIVAIYVFGGAILYSLF